MCCYNCASRVNITGYAGEGFEEAPGTLWVWAPGLPEYIHFPRQSAAQPPTAAEKKDSWRANALQTSRLAGHPVTCANMEYHMLKQRSLIVGFVAICLLALGVFVVRS